MSAAALSFEREFPASEAIFNILPIGIGFVDSHLSVLRMNSALRKIFSCPPSQTTPVPLPALDRHLAKLLDPVVQRVLKSNEIEENVELVSPAPVQGSVVLATVFPIDTAAGTVGLAIRILRNFIVSRKRGAGPAAWK